MGSKFGSNDSGSLGFNWGSPGDMMSGGQVPGESFGDRSRTKMQCWYIRTWIISATFERDENGCGTAKPPSPPQPPSGWHEGVEYEDYWNRVSEGPPVKGKWSGFMQDTKECKCIKIDPAHGDNPPENFPPGAPGRQRASDSGRAMDSYSPDIGSSGGGTRVIMMRTCRMLCKDCPQDPCKCKPVGGKTEITRIDPCSSEVDIELMDPSKQTNADVAADGAYPGKPPCGMLGEGGSK